MFRTWLVLVCLMLPIQKGDVAWLNEIQKEPAAKPQPVRQLSPLMTNEELGSKNALSQWESRRRELSGAWQHVLGPDLNRPSKVEIEVLEIEQLSEVTRKRIRYENEVGDFLTAYLLEPTGKSTKGPAIVALHATTQATNKTIAGIGGTRDEQIGLRLAEKGFTVICPENFLWVGGKEYDQAVADFQSEYPNSLGMRKMLFDASRAVDILVSLPNVDTTRIGAVGHSLGAKEVLYLTAFDDRISVAVFSEGGIEFESTNWQAPWYLGPIVQDKAFTRNHHELIALIAPRPFLVLGGETNGAADGDRTWPFIEAAMPIYKLYGGTPKVGLLNHHEGHTISDGSFEKIAEWFEVYLAQ